MYRQKERKLYGESMGYMGKGAFIEYPATLSHMELIYIGNGTQILANSRIQCYPELINGGECGIEIGENCYIVYGVTILSSAKITIGNNVLIAGGVCIVSHNHGMNPEEKEAYMDQQLVSDKISIGDGCWIGQNVMIMPGVKIGKCCIIGAGGVVTHNVPDYCVAVGSPAKVVKQYDFSKHIWVSV